MTDTRPGIALSLYRTIVWSVVILATLLLITRPFPPFPEHGTFVEQDASAFWGEQFDLARANADQYGLQAESTDQHIVVNGWQVTDQLEILGYEVAEVQDILYTTLQHQENQWRWEMRERRVESLLVVFALGAAAHLLGSAVASLGAARRAQRRAAPVAAGTFPAPAPGNWPPPQMPAMRPPYQPYPSYQAPPQPAQPQPQPQPPQPQHHPQPATEPPRATGQQWPSQPPVDFV